MATCALGGTRTAAAVVALALAAACSGTPPIPEESGDGPEAMSLLGTPLYRPAIGESARTTLEANLAAAQAAYDASPQDPETLLWLGRRLAYLGRYRDAIAAFSRGVSEHPRDARFYRHRGHRYITVRDLDAAVRDLAQAADLVRGTPDEVEPDGAPNQHNIPRSTLQSNIFYHLALAHYLKGDFSRALPVWIEALEVSDNDDMHVATADWLYMTYRRLGREADAARVLEPIHGGMEILENDAYHRRLLMYKGVLPADSLLEIDTGDPVQLATYGYGVGNWFLYNGDRARAVEVFERILNIPNWAAFGYIAAEAELARLR
jgi:tetratricopeptide (TPR) repeat protein